MPALTVDLDSVLATSHRLKVIMDEGRLRQVCFTCLTWSVLEPQCGCSTACFKAWARSLLVHSITKCHGVQAAKNRPPGCDRHTVIDRDFGNLGAGQRQSPDVKGPWPLRLHNPLAWYRSAWGCPALCIGQQGQRVGHMRNMRGAVEPCQHT